MATLIALKPFIPSGSDWNRSRAFFLDLGFSIAWEVDGYAELQLGGAAFILQHSQNQEMQDNLMMFARVDDLDGWWRHILDTRVIETYGVQAKPPTDYPWGQREVHLIDPAGVCWHFA